MKVFIGILSLLTGLSGLISMAGAFGRILSVSMPREAYTAALLEGVPRASIGLALLLFSILLAIYARISQASAYQERNHKGPAT